MFTIFRQIMRAKKNRLVSIGLAKIFFRIFHRSVSFIGFISVLASLTICTDAYAKIDLDIKGVDGPTEENIKLHLSKWEKLPSNNIEGIKEKFEKNIQQALRAMGYYSAIIEYQLGGDELMLNINSGEPIKWKNVDIQLLHDKHVMDVRLQTVIDANPFIVGERINHKVYEGYKKSLLNSASEFGYLDAKFNKSELQINPENYEASVKLILEMGQRYKIGDVIYTDTDIRKELLGTLAEVKKDEWYSANTVGLIYNRMLNTGYFSGVTVNVKKETPNIAHLTIGLTDAPKHRVSTGVGFGTDDNGPRVRLKWQRPRINTRGDSLSAQLKISQVEQNVSAQYRMPWDHPLNEYLSYDVGWQQKITEDITTQLATAGASYHRVVKNGWQYSFHLDVENETSQTDDLPEESFTYVIPGVQFSRRRFSGDAADPLKGYKFWANLSTSRESLGSDTDFHRFDIGTNGIITAFKKHSLLGRVELGYIETDDLLKVPPSQRFFAGGDQTVRGYKYESISPVDSDGNLTGGQYSAIASIEYRYQFLKNWKAAIFYDTAQIYRDDPTELPADAVKANNWLVMLEDAKQFKSGAGIGIRWKTPIGLVAFDIATPINQENNDVRFHFYLGTPL
ncbi:MAG: outer membrane protein assembly factor [Cellvibrionaceae bacterium]